MPVSQSSPVTNSYFVRKCLIHNPVSHLDEECKILIAGVYCFLSSIFYSFSIWRHSILRPIALFKQITEAAKEAICPPAIWSMRYQSPQDEIGYLSLRLNYVHTGRKIWTTIRKIYCKRIPCFVLAHLYQRGTWKRQMEPFL